MCLYCVVGEILVAQSENIHRATYEYAWYTIDPKGAKNLLLIMLRSNKPLYITAGKTFPITMATLCNLLKTSAGYISVLLANQDKVINS
ncbi:PREDICTED: odorant receptor 49b-like [Dinoponera quadriceps]|uniref:Odorant receptor 49b-like n=1 Tax=Dinoponera quadriceps TaxID=609295 RepID=A0A6P3Y799_DINQU|nr:PREDICTED: odorant receptor 49b-like [Dinoponera quadriceps]